MRIRFFNLSDTAAPFFRDLVPSLLESGHRVDLVLGASNYREGLGLDERVGTSPRLRLIRTASPAGSRGLFGKTFSSLAYTLQASLYSLLGPAVDINVFLTQPPMFSAWGLPLRWLRRQPFICVMMDVYPEMFWEIGPLRQAGLPARFLSVLDRMVLGRAAAVVTIGRCMLHRLQEKGVDPARLHLIRNWVDESRLLPIPREKNRFREEQSWQWRTVVLYAGNLGVAQDFDDLLKTAAALQHRSDIGFVWIGDGSRRAALLKAVRELQLENVAILPFQHEAHPLSQVLSAGDVHFVSLRAGCSGLAVPSKSYAIHAVGRPILYQGDAHDEVARTLGEEDVGTLIGRGDVEALTRAVLGYADQPQLARRQGEKARRLAMGRYSRGRALEAYHSLFRDLKGPKISA